MARASPGSLAGRPAPRRLARGGLGARQSTSSPRPTDVPAHWPAGDATSSHLVMAAGVRVIALTCGHSTVITSMAPACAHKDSPEPAGAPSASAPRPSPSSLARQGTHRDAHWAGPRAVRWLACRSPCQPPSRSPWCRQAPARFLARVVAVLPAGTAAVTGRRARRSSLAATLYNQTDHADGFRHGPATCPACRADGQRRAGVQPRAFSAAASAAVAPTLLFSRRFSTDDVIHGRPRPARMVRCGQRTPGEAVLRCWKVRSKNASKARR